MKKKILLLSTAAFLFSGVAFAQTGKDSTKVKEKAKKDMPKSCPGKSCGKKKA
jgi:hypothetical protein